uniref:Glucose-methanol-choline oxidoreductase C-terminal domain-containing protein n=1 Tax=Ananas comosus var. bracteatus TaxID=296719 RepID=A0A6V7PX07_ANACO|nr:unnamed protein product [Ananas comosus var. bracteatus]
MYIGLSKFSNTNCFNIQIGKLFCRLCADRPTVYCPSEAADSRSDSQSRRGHEQPRRLLLPGRLHPREDHRAALDGPPRAPVEEPRREPRRDLQLLPGAEDLRRCVDGIRTIERVVASDAFTKFTYAYLPEAGLLNISKDFPVNLLPKHQNDSRSLEQYCKDTVMTIWHYHGGCRVGGVVDADYRVLGADALRVVDSSTFIYSRGLIRRRPS